jgi:hypothetical protein
MAFTKDGMVISPLAATALDLEYNGVSYEKPDYDCICETSYFDPKTPQHFFILRKDGSINDPLGKNINYPIKSYRLFKAKESEGNMPFNDQEVREMIRANVRVWGEHEPTEDEINGHLAAIKERQKEPNDWALSEYEIDRHEEFSPKYVSVEENDRLKEQMQGALIRIDEQTESITKFEKAINKNADEFESQIDTKEKEIEDLALQIGTLMTEVEDWKVKYKELEKSKVITYKCDFWSIIKSIFKKG